MTNPFLFDISGLGAPGSTATTVTLTGPSPVRIGNAMIAIDKGQDITVEAELTPLGQSVMVDATVTTTLTGQCSRCLEPITADYTFEITDVFLEDASVVHTIDEDGGEDDDEEAIDELSLVTDDTIDLTQNIIDAVGLDVPFSPECSDYGLECDEECMQRIAGVIDGDEDAGGPQLTDIRWAGLEKFK